MFCSNCGANIGNANFCPICGNKTNQDYVIAQDCNLDISSHDNGVQQVNNLIITENCSVGQTSKEKALEEVDKLFDYFNQKADLYKEYDSLIKSYQKLSNGKDSWHTSASIPVNGLTNRITISFTHSVFMFIEIR